MILASLGDQNWSIAGHRKWGYDQSAIAADLDDLIWFYVSSGERTCA